MPVDPHNATFVERINCHEDLALFRVAYNDQDVPDFEPGQFATLGLPDPTQPNPDAPHTPRPRAQAHSPGLLHRITQRRARRP